MPTVSHRLPASTAKNTTRERLLQVAIEEFALRGCEQVTIRDICGKAGANLNAVKYYFTDKQGLYVEAVRAAHRANQGGQGPVEVDEIAEQFSGSAEDRLRAFIAAMVAMAMAAQDHSDFNRMLIFREIGSPTIATEHIVKDFIRPHFERLNMILAELVSPSTPTIDRQLLAFSVVGQCMHYKMAGSIIPMLVSKANRKRMTPQRVAEHITSITLAAISAHEPT